jgi:Tfp pilus assembly protein PilO
MRSVRSQTAWCKRAQWSMTVFMVSLIAVFFVFGFRPATQRLTALRTDIVAKSQRLETNQGRAMMLPGLQVEVDRLRLRLERFNKKLPKTAELGEFIRDLTNVSQQYAIRKLIHQPGTVRRLDLYGEIPITMSFEGDFASVFGFVRQLEEMQRLTRVKTINVRCKDGKLGHVDVSMAMNIYFSEF